MRAVRFRVVLVTAVMLLLVAVPAASEPLTRQPGPYTVTVGDDDRMNPLSGKPISIHATVNGTTSSGRKFALRGLNLGDVVYPEAEPGAFKDTDGTCWVFMDWWISTPAIDPGRQLSTWRWTSWTVQDVGGTEVSIHQRYDPNPDWWWLYPECW
jgi:hypothetical protein